jgi:hypothetical protein
MFEASKELEKGSVLVLREPLLVLLEDCLPCALVVVVVELEDSSDFVLWTAVKPDLNPARPVEWDPEDDMAYLLCGPVSFGDQTVHHLSCERQRRLKTYQPTN